MRSISRLLHAQTVSDSEAAEAIQVKINETSRQHTSPLCLPRGNEHLADGGRTCFRYSKTAIVGASGSRTGPFAEYQRR
jgi:hypothetical protein